VKLTTFGMVLCAVLVCLSPPVSVTASDDVPLIVFEDYPPYEYMEGDEAKGINIDLIREAFRRMGVTPVFELRPWKRALMELKSGEVMALSSGFKTKEREGFAIFPDEPLAMEVNVITTLASCPLQIFGPRDLRGLSLGVVREYTYGAEVDGLGDVERVETNSSRQLLDMLLAGRMDAAVGNRAVFDHQAARIGRRNDLRYACEIGRGALYLFFSRARGARAEALSRRFGQAIAAMRRDGTFAAIEAKY
jgi:polar amino acid transport system substrate-binding protein